MNFVFPPWARIALMVLVFFAGYWTRGSIEARQEVHEQKQQLAGDQEYDQAVADKLRAEAEGDAKRAGLNRKNEKAADNDPTYRQYLRSPVPERSLEFLRDAERIDYGPDGADASAQDR